MKKLQQQFGVVVRRRREAVGLSQESLADKARLHRTYISLLERGLKMPSILVAKRIAESLGTTMAELLGEVDQELVQRTRTKKRATP